ncbi:MAG: phosphatase PAP2 family protein [Candidatus Marinimicrobia bacterium]|jgi:hypothetical protein|nr:phosphatase PAP2 family protein [Candidatus Neomarinimicrobiota bacterium]MBT3617543.1 phosphatase PAP2 family protein [Candidatus Neomarinimicrobiota bacterium]MBT3829220.1 phosphatase PAP2 family protein [Candidatus Neomarinimicrobiota bacterium]MBT3996786.1 phosphatase PAP2 family protein [Candidatus Neomarinimicrobiota bacterium]MBT4280344.1 phosphatase PAP2 family protein [Candidatus Neomarinimicrobiota bacterium]
MRRSLILLILGINILFPKDQKIPDYIKAGIHESYSGKSNKIIIGSTILGAVIAYQYDTNLQSYAQRQGLMSESTANFADDFVMDGWSIGILTGGIIAEHFLSDNSKLDLHRKFKYAFTSMATSTVLTYGLKYGVARERPNLSNSRSFPSGHTSHSFTIAAVSQELFGFKIGVAAYTMAFVVGLSRIQDNKHYLSDVMFGAGLGTVIGRGFGMVYKKETIAASFQPTLDGKIKMSVRF